MNKFKPLHDECESHVLSSSMPAPGSSMNNKPNREDTRDENTVKPVEVVKKTRKPWSGQYITMAACMSFICCTPTSVLIRVNDRPQDLQHQEYLLTVLKTIGEIEYRKLRQDWLAYQNCSIDVVTFCKRTKLLFRGDRSVVDIFTRKFQIDTCHN